MQPQVICYNYFRRTVQLFITSLIIILVVLAPLSYTLSIVKGRTKPHRMTRFILAFVLALNFISILAAHGNTGATILATVFCLQGIILFVLSLWRGMGGSNIFDWLCLCIAFLGIAGWKMTGNPFIGVWFSVLADFAAYLPAFVKTWHHPQTESPWFYLLGFIASILSLFAYRLDASSIFQFYIAASSLTMVGFIYRTRITRAVVR